MLNIYKLYDEKDNLLYIGKTKNIHQRITQHLSEKDSVLWKASIDKIMIADVETEIDLDLYETYLINTLNPKYNSAKLYKGKTRLKFEDLKFYEYQRRIDLNRFYKCDTIVLGFCYKIFIYKSYDKFKTKDIMEKFNMPKTTVRLQMNKAIELNLIENIGEGFYKLSNDFRLM